MANPFLVLGGVAVGVVTAAFGILQVPGWVASAQDAAAVNDLSSAAITEAALANTTGEFHPGSTLAAQALVAGTNFTLSDGVKLCISTSVDGKSYAAVARSASGAFFARTNAESSAKTGATPDAAVAAAGGLPTGVTQPYGADGCEEAGAEVPGDITARCDTATTVALSDARDAAYTSRGIYAVNGTQLVCSTPDGRTHPVAFDGTASSMTARSVASDTDGNVYVAGTFLGTTGVFRIAPDMKVDTVWATAGTLDGIRVVAAPAGVHLHVPGTSLTHVAADGTVTDVAMPAPAAYATFNGSDVRGRTFWSTNTNEYVKVFDSSGNEEDSISSFLVGSAGPEAAAINQYGSLLLTDTNGMVFQRSQSGAGQAGTLNFASAGIPAGAPIAITHEGQHDGANYLRIAVNPHGASADSWMVVKVESNSATSVVMR